MRHLQSATQMKWCRFEQTLACCHPWRMADNVNCTWMYNIPFIINPRRPYLCCLPFSSLKQVQTQVSTITVPLAT